MENNDTFESKFLDGDKLDLHFPKNQVVQTSLTQLWEHAIRNKHLPGKLGLLN